MFVFRHFQRQFGARFGLMALCCAVGFGLPAVQAQPLDATDQFNLAGTAYVHTGGGVFEPVRKGSPGPPLAAINLKQIAHVYGPETDPDVPVFTDVTLPGITPPLHDEQGRAFAQITLYNVDPPLEDLPSAEPGIDRGMDYRDPSNIVKGVYSNYVSPVFTNDAERVPVAGHPIGHFMVKVEVPGYPAILTGMTTTARADVELVDLSLARGLGLGGVLLTRQPGRLNSSAEAAHELSLRQRELLVIDGLNYRSVGGRNVGPTFIIDDGNVVFLRVRVPLQNGKDALGAFLEFVQRGQHNLFGSLLSRPGRGSGAGCSAFAMHWLKASGVIPFVDETQPAFRMALEASPAPFWASFYRLIPFPWEQIGCDSRVGFFGSPEPADYAIYDLLFHDLRSKDVASAVEGLAELIRRDQGAVTGTLFQYGALTPVRDLVIRSYRKDPYDLGSYAWADPGDGLAVGFWDNAGFSDWIKSQWAATDLPENLALVREGRFIGIELDAMEVPRQAEPFFDVADKLAAERHTRALEGMFPANCREAFTLYPLE